MSGSTSKQVAETPPWWLSGQELCVFCCHHYVLEWEFRCVECDHPVCPLCAVVVKKTATAYCPECSGGAKE